MKTGSDFQGLQVHAKRLFTWLSLVTLITHGFSVSRAQDPETSRVIEIGVIPGALKFDISEFDAYPNEKLQIKFSNNGLMQHNVIFTTPNQADKIVNEAMALGSEGAGKNWIPDSNSILYSIPLVDPKKSFKLDIVAPSSPGKYPYVCTFPGHGIIMRGIMVIKPMDEKLSPLSKESSSSIKVRNNLQGVTYTNRPLGSKNKPLVIRTYMPDPGIPTEVFVNHGNGKIANKYSPNVGDDVPGTVLPIKGIPAAFGINFGDEFSLCWDTTECRLLYTWKDGFLNMDAYWGGNGGAGRKSFDYVPRLEGTTTFIATGFHPIRINGRNTTPVFRKMQIVEKSNIVFSYVCGESTISESFSLNSQGHISYQVSLTSHKNETVVFKLPDHLVKKIQSINGKNRKNLNRFSLRAQSGESKSATITLKF